MNDRHLSVYAELCSVLCLPLKQKPACDDDDAGIKAALLERASRTVIKAKGGGGW